MSDIKHFHCPKCGAQWTQPSDIPDEVTRQAGSLIRDQQPMQAIKLLRETCDLSLGDAKAAMLHVSRQSGHCNRCDSLLAGGVQCENCNAMVLDW